MNDLRRKISKYDTALGVAKMQLREAQELECVRKKLEALVVESDSLVATLAGSLEDLHLLNMLVGKEEVNFKSRRLDALDSIITEWLQFTFPRKKLKSKIYCNYDRRKTKLRLDIVDAHGNARPPAKTEGSLNQQLIAITAAYGCTKLLGRNILYCDESLSKASMENLAKLQVLLDQIVKDGFQVILISQSEVLYADIDRHLIMLRSTDGDVVDRVEYQDVVHMEAMEE